MAQANFKITIEYDGTEFHGWQRQKHERTIQGEIERALRLITEQQVLVIGSGRTDAGVHALGQVANFVCDTRLSPAEFQKALNSLLPAAIVIVASEQVDMAFHARYDVQRKLYRYSILNRPLRTAIGRRYAWHISRPLDLKAMRAAAGELIGHHDFKAFEGAGSPRSHSFRKVFRTDFIRAQATDRLAFEIEADGFLRFMVRNIVGTLVRVGSGDIGVAEFREILLSKNRSRAGITAPPHGLFLVGVTYP